MIPRLLFSIVFAFFRPLSFVLRTSYLLYRRALPLQAERVIFSRLASTSHGVPLWSVAIVSSSFAELFAIFLPVVSPDGVEVEASFQPLPGGSFGGSSLRI